MEFVALLSLVAGGNVWPPRPDPVSMDVQIRALEKGLTVQQVKDRLRLTKETPVLVGGTTMSHILEFRIGSTHDLTLFFGRGANGWEFYHAELRPSDAEPPPAEVEWPLSWPKVPKP